MAVLSASCAPQALASGYAWKVYLRHTVGCAVTVECVSSAPANISNVLEAVTSYLAAFISYLTTIISRLATIVSFPGAVISFLMTIISAPGAIASRLMVIASVPGTVSCPPAATSVRVSEAESMEEMRRRCISMRSRLQATTVAQLAGNMHKKGMFPKGGLIRPAKPTSTSGGAFAQIKMKNM